MTGSSTANLASGGDTTGRHDEYIAMAAAYDAWLANAGMDYPATPARFDRICMKLVSAESGIHYETLAHDTAIRREVLAFKEARGLEPRVRSRINTEHTVAELQTICAVRLRDERPDDAGLFVIVNSLLLGLGSSAGPAADAATALAGDLRRVGEEARLYVETCLAEARAGCGTPKTFHLRLKYEFALRGVSPRYVAHVLDLKQSLVERWANNHRRPTQAHKDQIHRLEDWLGLDRGLLWSQIGIRSVRAGHVASRDVPVQWRENRYRRKLFVRALPSDYATKNDDEKKILAGAAIERLARAAKTERAKLGRQRSDRYALKKRDFTPRLMQEFDQLRRARRPKVLLFNDLDRKNGWNDRSFDKWQQRFCGFLGFLHRRLPELVNVEGYRPEDRKRDVVYVNVALDDLTLAFAAMPPLIMAYERWLNWRKTTFGRTGKPTPDDIEFVHELERMCRPAAASFEDAIAGL
jgi:hypothetical protein